SSGASCWPTSSASGSTPWRLSGATDGAATLRPAVSRADVELLRAAGVKPDPGGLATFQRAVVRAWRSEDRRDRQEACREAGESLLRLAAGGAAADLRAVLTPDPVNSNVTWTVACYQIGDLTP